MAGTELELDILSPAKKLFSGKVTEVVLPAYDGEVGVLPGHVSFVGVLGTGPLKIVRGGDDFWFMVSSGLYQITEDKVTIFAELAEDAKSINLEGEEAKVKELESKLASPSEYTLEEYPRLKLDADRARARVDVHKRTELLN